MKKLLLLSLCIGAMWGANAQPLRYYDKIYDDVQVVKDQVYGSNYVFNFLELEFGLTKEDQTLDIYLPPAQDQMPDRPLIVWAHGGSFLGGTKEDKDIVYFCNEYAKRGFVCISINYRIGYELPLDSIKAVRTVYRALQDGRAAVRYMRSRASEFNIDKNRVYFGGTSAGAFIALNTVFLDRPEEVPSYVDTSGHDELNLDPQIGLDGIEGKTNEIAESSEIMGIINYCGATKVTSWMDDEYARNVPMISMHGTRDSTVPYATRVIKLNDLTPIPPQIPLPIVQVQGSYDIDRHADRSGMSSKFYTWYGADHVPYVNYDDNGAGAAYMDTVMRFTVKHVYEDFLKLGTVPGLGENEPPCDFNNGDENPCAISGIANEASNGQTVLYPNPAGNLMYISGLESGSIVTLVDLNGRICGSFNCSELLEINTADLEQGVYTVVIRSGGTVEQKRAVIVR
ncbi:MAG: alpha/beta hydrolase fold domain-containing protein [Bacteroidota bacterium]